MHRVAWAIPLMLVGLAGCVSDEPAQVPGPLPEIVPALLADGRIQLDVEVPVILIGYGPGVASGLRTALEPLRPDHVVYNNARLLNPFGGTSPTRPVPMDPTADYRVIEAPDAVALILRNEIPSFEVAPGLLDANAVDDRIAELLQASQIRIDPGAPALVLLHLTDESHSYRLQYVTGYVDNVRAFGERHPFLVLDTSANIDPWVGNVRPYHAPLAPEGDETVDALRQVVERATHYRLLQGPLYPQSTKACHAVTLLVLVRGTHLAQYVPGYTTAGDLLDVEELTMAWESLLGEGRVFIDADIVYLPQDDPVLEAATRDPTNEALRLWADQTWDQYWVAHDGCEAYISVFLIGDATDRGVSGIAMYDLNDDRRISMSNLNDLTIFAEQDGALGPVLHIDDPSRNETDWVDFLFTHETGHLFGQRHPHDISVTSGGGFEGTFSSIWSAMSYQQDGKIPRFGSIDTNNYWRNRAGFVVEEALMQEVDQPSIDEALRLMGQYRWQEAGDVLQPMLSG